MKRTSSFFAFAVALILPLAAAAQPISKPKWTTAKQNGPLHRQDKSGTNWIRHRDTLHVRSQKPRGGYFYHPVCLRQGEVSLALPGAYGAGIQRWKCMGTTGGQVVSNGDEFTWELGQHMAQRGRISIYSLTYVWNGETRVVCKAKVGGNEIPGYFALPPADTVPTECNVMLMGQWVGLPIHSVAKAKTSGLPSLPSSGNGWWTPPKDWPASIKGADPIYQVFDNKQRALCRAKQGPAFHVGHVVAKNNASKRRTTACKFRGPGSTSYGIAHDYDIYIGAGGSTWGPRKSGSSTSFGNAVLANPSSSASARVYACQDSAGNAGWAKSTNKRCYTVGGSPAGVTTFRTLMK